MTDAGILPGETLLADMRALCGDQVADDYVNMMNQVSQPRFYAIKNGFRDPTAVFIMVCANGNMLYKDMREAGKKLGLGSVETFSRRIFEMRRAGLIYTESVRDKGPGRPQLRLMFNPGVFSEMFNTDPGFLLAGRTGKNKIMT